MPFEEEDLNLRERDVLKAIIHAYLMTAEPVSSKIVVDNFDFKVSSATIRNIMAELEGKGYIEQLHTSGGRVPTDNGYRFYVAKLMQLRRLSKAEESRIEKEYYLKKREINFIMQHTSKVLSTLTNYTGMITSPIVKTQSLAEIKLVKIDDFRFVVIAIFNTGVVQDSIISVSEMISEREMVFLAASLTVYVKNNKDINEVKKFITSNDDGYVAKKIFTVFSEIINLDIFEGKAGAIEEIYFEGSSNLASYPEFRNYEKLSDFLRLLDEKIELRDILNENLKEDGVNIYIGKQEKGIENCSIVTSPYKIGEEKVGVLGIIGPKRMGYSKVVSAVEYLASTVSTYLTQVFKGR